MFKIGVLYIQALEWWGAHDAFCCLVMLVAQRFCFALKSLLFVDLGVAGDKGRGAKTVIMPPVNKPHNRPFNGLKEHNENTGEITFLTITGGKF